MVPSMSETATTALVILELTGLIGLFALLRVSAKRRVAGERLARPVRIAIALIGLFLVVVFPVLIVLALS
jgi:hypothetical protein